MKLRILLATAAFFAAQFSTPAVMAQESTLDVVKKRGGARRGSPLRHAALWLRRRWRQRDGHRHRDRQRDREKLGVKVELKQVTAQTRIPMLTSGNIDLIAAGIGHTLEREQAVDFTVTYFENVTQFAVKSDSPIKSYRDLAGKTVASLQGTPHFAGLKAKESTAKPLTLQEYPQAILAVMDGKADAFMGDDATLLLITKQNKNVKVVGDPHDFPRWRVALAIRSERFQVAQFSEYRAERNVARRRAAESSMGSRLQVRPAIRDRGLVLAGRTEVRSSLMPSRERHRRIASPESASMPATRTGSPGSRFWHGRNPRRYSIRVLTPPG
jgi:ABC-type amino acid transport substrate-binding protein